MKKTAVIVLTDGFEEIEAVTPVDVLRRAAIEVTVAGLSKLEVKGSRGLGVKADCLLQDCQALPEVVILPGGPGAETLGQSDILKKFLQRMIDAKKNIAAICAAPALVLGRHGFLNGVRATCYPGYEKPLGPGAIFVEAPVVRDGFFLTSRGPGTAMAFSFELVRMLTDERTARVVAEKMLATS